MERLRRAADYESDAGQAPKEHFDYETAVREPNAEALYGTP